MDPKAMNFLMERTRIVTNMELIKAGKPCSKILVHVEHVEKFKALIIKEDLSVYTKPSLTSESWVALWIFKHNYMLPIINNLPDNPETAFDHWVLGKAFGYSDEAINEFLEKLSKGESPIILES